MKTGKESNPISQGSDQKGRAYELNTPEITDRIMQIKESHMEFAFKKVTSKQNWKKTRHRRHK